MISDSIAVALIMSIPGAIAAIGSVIVIIQNVRSRVEAKAGHDETKNNIQQLTLRVNGRLDQLLASAEDKGRVAEQAEQHGRDAAKFEQS